MRVKDIMSSDVASCRPDMDLAAVAQIMWDRDCGFVPVVDEAGTLCGVITDRDICIAAATRGVAPQEIRANQAMHPVPLFTVGPDDWVDAGLATMRHGQVRRLPVIDEDGKLAGVLSLNDISMASNDTHAPAPSEVVSTLAAICSHRDILATA
jgi:CBS domain-containing protein